RAAAWVGDIQGITDALVLLDQQRGRVPEAVRAEARAALAALERRRSEAAAGFSDAARLFRELGFDFETAMCNLDLVRTLGASDPGSSAAAEEARAIFERLGARPLLDRLAEAERTPTGGRPATGRAAQPTIEVPAE
ncbi:MAG: hypothetical protein ABIO99_11475, partial [Candidatus Limnocylindria bacterium]